MFGMFAWRLTSGDDDDDDDDQRGATRGRVFRAEGQRRLFAACSTRRGIHDRNKGGQQQSLSTRSPSALPGRAKIRVVDMMKSTVDASPPASSFLPHPTWRTT